MQTRQTNRKPITLAGRYFTGQGTPTDVTITDLSSGGCRFASRSPFLTRGARVQIYLEKSGPHHALVKWIEDGEIGVTFNTPLSEDDFATFQNSHVPAVAEDRRAGAFEDMPKSLPNRFC